MAATTEEEQATELAREAVSLMRAGDKARATATLRQASAIAPDSDCVKASWKVLQQEEGESELVQACRRWVVGQKEEDGKQILRSLNSGQWGTSEAAGAFELLAEFYGESDTADAITGAMLKHQGARGSLATHFSNQPTTVYEQFWARGERSVDGLLAVLLEPTLWVSGEAHTASQRDLLQLSLAKLMDVGVDHPEWAMKAIARLLATNGSRLHGVIDGDSFDAILDSLDIRQPNALRSHATVVTAKYLEESTEHGQRLLANYVTSKVAQPTIESLILALSAVAALFSIQPSAAAELLLYEGFMERLVPLVREHHRSRTLQQAALELLSASCTDKGCREAIAKNCLTWLRTIANESSHAKTSNLASLIVVKVKDTETPGTNGHASDAADQDQSALVARFKSLVLEPEESTLQDAIEGLAYSSLRPEVKEDLALDKSFLKSLVENATKLSSGGPLMYGILTIFAHLTKYRPALSEEQQRISQLKAYANASKPAQHNPLDDDKHVTARCKSALEAGVVPLLVRCSKNASPNLLLLILQTLLSLSKTSKHRGLLAQQGAVKVLLQASSRSSNGANSNGSDHDASPRAAAHALARILISVNPAHVFSSSSSLPMASAVRPLLSLLYDDPTAEHRDLLPLFEALLALTNLASTTDEIRDMIIRLAWPQLENLLLSNNTLVQRATVELVCNLMASPNGVIKFADGSKQAGNRLHILLALADVEDLETRRAAGGALAMLTEWDAAVDAVIARERGVKILLGLCAEENDEMRHRGVVCVKNVVLAPAHVGQKGKEKVEMEGGVAILKDVLKKSRNRDVLAIVVELLKSLI